MDCYYHRAMLPAFTIVVNAALLARTSGAAEIGVDELLAVLDDDFVPEKAQEPPVDDRLIPIPKHDVALSPAASAAIAAAGGLNYLCIEKLRSALIDAKRGE